MVEETTILKGATVKTQADTDFDKFKNTEYYFDIIQEHSLQIQNQITDNYLENNTAVGDHIAQTPLTITLRGLAGEVVYTPPTKVLDELYDRSNDFLGKKYGNTKVVTDKLTALPMLLPSVDNITQLAKNAVQLAEVTYNRYKKIANYFTSDLQRESRLEEVYRKLSVLRASNSAFIVETPYKSFQDMYIQSLTLRQGNERYITDVELTLKQVRFAEVTTTGVDETVRTKYNAYQQALQRNYGIAQGKSTSGSILFNIFKPSHYKIRKRNGRE